MNRSNQILVRSNINTILTANRGIHHGQDTGGHESESQPTHVDGRHVTGDICDYSSADANEKSLSICFKFDKLTNDRIHRFLDLIFLTRFQNDHIPALKLSAMVPEYIFIGDDYRALSIHQIGQTREPRVEVNFGGLIRELKDFFLHAPVK